MPAPALVLPLAAALSPAVALLLAVALPPLAAPALAQDGSVTYDVPAFTSPFPAPGTGVHLIRPRDFGEVGLVASWARPGAVAEVRLRGGLTSLLDEVGVVGGLDVQGSLVTAYEAFPLDVAWVTGGGVGAVPALDVTLVRVPVGLSFGRRFPVEDGHLTVYAYPRLAVDARFSEEPETEPAGRRARLRGGDAAELRFDVDLGVDVGLPGGRLLRAAATLGHNEALGIGVVF